MDFKDYYKILGVSKTASAKEIKAAYRKLARKFHPDVNPGKREAEARFKEINEANEVLSDPEKRRRYDEMGADWPRFQGAGGGWPGGQGARVHVRGFGGEGQEFADFSDFFQTFFGGAAAGSSSPFGDLFEQAGAGPSAGADLEQGIELTLEEVLAGAKRTLASGSGRQQRRVEVRVPPGVREGSRVRVAGEGSPGGRGRRGDLYLRVHVRPHPQFERKGDDLHTSVQVPLTTAVLGGEASVPTLDGAREIRIPPGTPVGRVFRLRGLGLPRLEQGGGRGDLLAALSVALPESLTEKERELFQELRRLGR